LPPANTITANEGLKGGAFFHRSKIFTMRSKPIFNRILCCLCFLALGSLSAKADCVYDQTVKSDDLPIGIMLTWRTAVETNNSIFIIERSTDGRNFSNVGTVKGAGNSRLVKNYNFLDPNANAPKCYYRLKQVDFDGTFSYSDPIVVQKKIANNLLIVNVSSERTPKNFSVSLDAANAGSVTCQLRDMQGRVVMEQQKSVFAGLNNLTFDLSTQAEGAYRLVMKQGNEEETLVLQKTRDAVAADANVAGKARTTRN
jgi:hypothetical protein